MIYDIHAHLFHPRWYPPVFHQVIVREFLRRLPHTRPSASLAPPSRLLLKLLTDDSGATTLRLMDLGGIDKRVILILDWGLELGQPQEDIWEIHEQILAICRRFPDRLLGFAGIDPRRENAAELLRRAFDDLGAKGLKLYPSSGWSLTDERTIELVSLAAQRNRPVLVHLGQSFDLLSSLNAHPLPFMQLAGQFPSIPFIAGHSGFDLWRVFVKADAVPNNIYFEVSGWQNRYADSTDGLLAELSSLHQAFPGKVCFGTDSPFFSFNLLFAERHWIERVVPCFANRWADVSSWL